MGLAVNVAMMLLAFADVAVIGSLFRGQVAARFGLGVYSCLWSQMILLRRPRHLNACLRGLAGLAASLERRDAHPASLVSAERTARTALLQDL